MSAISLLAVLIVAKALVLQGRAIAMSGWTPVAYFSQDVLVAAAFAVVDLSFRRSRLVWVAYALAVAYVAIDVPVTRVLGSPLTASMLRAARGPLRDSIAQYLTLGNVSRIAAILLTGALMPVLAARAARWRLQLGLFAGASLFAVLGPVAASRVDTRGLDRNAFTALVPLSLPGVAAATDPGDWRDSPFASPPSVDLTRYRGSAKGFNVLVVVLESTAARYLRAYGALEDSTPTLPSMNPPRRTRRRHACRWPSD
jgi:hypothetical protein